MITVGSIHYAVKADAYYGLSTDTKPTGAIANGSVYVEMDTSRLYVYDAASAAWYDWFTSVATPINPTFAYSASDNI